MSRGVRGSKIVFAILAIIGAVALTGGFVLLARSLAMAATGQKTEGVVIQNVWSRGRRSTARPVVRFEAEGRFVEIKGAIGTRPPANTVGDRAIVLFSAGNPESAVINSFVEQYLLSIVFGGIGIVRISAHSCLAPSQTATDYLGRNSCSSESGRHPVDYFTQSQQTISLGDCRRILGSDQRTYCHSNEPLSVARSIMAISCRQQSDDLSFARAAKDAVDRAGLVGGDAACGYW